MYVFGDLACIGKARSFRSFPCKVRVHVIGHSVKRPALTVAFELIEQDGKRPVEELAVAGAEQAAARRETVPINCGGNTLTTHATDHTILSAIGNATYHAIALLITVG